MFDEVRGQLALAFCSALKATKGDLAGKPIQLLDFQKKTIVDIFGTVDEKGKRIIKEVFMLIGRKNGKSELSSAIALYMLVMDDEYGAEIYCAANTKEQASLVFNAACEMVRTNKTLSKMLKILPSTKKIVRYDNNSFLRAVSADAKTADGYNPHCVIYDEVHEAPNSELYDKLSGGMGARSQPLFINITTAGAERKGIWFNQFEYAKKVRDGLIDDPTFYPALYYLEDNEDWTIEGEPAEYDDNFKIIKPATGWFKANPALGKFKLLETMRKDLVKAKEIPSEEAKFRRYQLNQIIDKDYVWLATEKWLACNEDLPSEDVLKKIQCYGALDLSKSGDISCFGMVWKIGEKYVIKIMFFIPEENMRLRVKRDKVPYDQWVREGLMIATPGNVIDYNYIFEYIKKQRAKYNIAEIAFDRWGASKISIDLANEGFEMVEFGQGFKSMSPPTQELINLTLQKNIIHGNNPVLNWMSSHMKLSEDPAGNIKPDKNKSYEKIDGMVVVVMGLDRAIKNKTKSSIYEKKGVREV